MVERRGIGPLTRSAPDTAGGDHTRPFDCVTRRNVGTYVLKTVYRKDLLTYGGGRAKLDTNSVTAHRRIVAP
jgi:hypothetical protein